MFDPPISSGANLFIIVAVALIAFGAAIVAIDVYKEVLFNKEKKDKK